MEEFVISILRNVYVISKSNIHHNGMLSGPFISTKYQKYTRQTGKIYDTLIMVLNKINAVSGKLN